MKKSIHAIVKGRVQLVMFRDFANRKAQKHNILGTVKNLSDGSVEVFAVGDEKDVDVFLSKLHKGPVLSRVDSVTITELDGTDEPKGFSIIF